MVCHKKFGPAETILVPVASVSCILLNNKIILNLLCVPESVPHNGVIAYPDGLVTVIESPVHCPIDPTVVEGGPMTTVAKSSLIWQTSKRYDMF